MQKQKLLIKSLAQLDCLLPFGMHFHSHQIQNAYRERCENGRSKLEISFKWQLAPVKIVQNEHGEIDLKTVPTNLLVGMF